MQKKINVLLVCLVVFGILFTGVLQNNMSKASYIEDVKVRLISSAKLIREGADNYSSILTDEGFDFLKESAVVANMRVTLIGEDGWVRFDSEKNWEELENHRKDGDSRPEIELAFDGKIGISKRYSSSTEMDMYYVAIPYNNDGNAYVIRVSVPLYKIKEANQQTVKGIILVSLIGIILSLVIAGFASRRITKPIKELTEVTKRIADGHYDEKIYIKTGDEMGELAHNFNVMSDEINKQIQEINDRNVKTNAILSSMINGVIAVDNNKRIMFVNASAEQMFNFRESDVRGKRILEVLRNNALDDQIHHMIANNVMVTAELAIDEPVRRIFNLYSNPIVSSEIGNEKMGVVIIIQDVTEMKKLESMRKDFVANVSHELKTPLTSIKGFVETLLNGAAEKEEVREKFLGIINLEVERLSSLIEDLLVLSEIEKNETIANDAPININHATRNIMEMLAEVAKGNEVALFYNCSDDLPTIYGNEGWFKQMVVNLVDNAIKYSNKGGEVRVNIYKEDQRVKIVVKDTGVGIATEHLDRLFERFYRVDKARSRSIGGTGLGLAIVKHVVISFGGEIKVRSEFGKGSEFIVTIPVEQ
ncbi:MAG: HAMP domain-containing protein [Clostridia bacterium]|nr:HAMP domain-containing protein [Clostridia bacterium]